MVYCHVQGVEITPSYPMQFNLCKATPGKLMCRALAWNITLDDVLTILDEHYNNVKALDTLNQELFQLWDGRQRNCIGLGCLPFKTSPGSGCFLS